MAEHGQQTTLDVSREEIRVYAEHVIKDFQPLSTIEQHLVAYVFALLEQLEAKE